MSWKPITEDEKKEGNRILCYKRGWEFPKFMTWKHNQIIAEAKRDLDKIKNDPRYKEWAEKLSRQRESYFSDSSELDDYDNALPENAPEIWFDLPLP